MYTPTPARDDKPGTASAAHEEMVQYSYGAAPAVVRADPLPHARLGSPIRSTQGAPASAVEARRSRWRSGEPDRDQPAGDPDRVPEHGPGVRPARSVPIDGAAADRPRWRPIRPPAPDPAREALPAGAGPLEGNLVPPDTPLPARVHEANLTRDRDGNPVFQVYRPEGSRFYAQDE